MTPTKITRKNPGSARSVAARGRRDVGDQQSQGKEGRHAQKKRRSEAGGVPGQRDAEGEPAGGDEQELRGNSDVIGIPLALLLIAVYVAALLLSGVCIAFWIGAWLVQRTGHAAASPYAQLAVGAVIPSVLLGLPWIGWVFWLAVALFGYGGLALERRDLRQRLRAEGLA